MKVNIDKKILFIFSDFFEAFGFLPFYIQTP